MNNKSFTKSLSKAFLFCVGCIVSTTGFGQEKNPGDVIWEVNNWQIDLKTPVIGNDGIIYYTSQNALHAVNADGSIKWDYNSVPLGKMPTILEDGNIFLTNTYQISSIKPEKSYDWTLRNSYEFFTNPAVDSNNNIILVADNKTTTDQNKSLIKIKNDQTIEWELLRENKSFIGTPVIGIDGTIYVGTTSLNNSNAYCAISKKGMKKWELELDTVFSFSSAIAVDGTIYFPLNKNLLAVTKEGLLKWTFKTDSRITTPPVIGIDGTIYFGSSNYVHAINPNGSSRWIFKSAGAVVSTPSIGNDRKIYFGSRDGIYSLNSDGSEDWRLLSSSRNSTVIGKDGILYITSDKLMAIKTSSTGPANSAWPMLGQNSRRTYSVSLPVIIEEPKSLIALKGQKANFNVKTVGTEDLSYQWYKNDIPIDGEKHLRLQLENVEESDEGRYSVRVQNIFGQTFSSQADLQVPASDTIILTNGKFSKKETIAVNKIEIKIKSNIEESEIFYTLDGSKPSFTSIPYTRPFDLNISATIRAIAYSKDFTKSAESKTTKVKILKTYTLSFENSGGGSVLIDSPDDSYIEGTNVTITAKPEGKWQFIKWAGAKESSSPTITVTMDSNKTLKPIFGTNIKVNVVGDGKIIQTPENPVPYGSIVNFEAVPNDGSYFYRWAGIISGNKQEETMLINNQDLFVSGLFDKILNIDEGELVWEFPANLASSPAISLDGTTYITTADGLLNAVNKNGKRLWVFNTNVPEKASCPSISNNGDIYFVSSDYILHSINKAGKLNWKFNIPGTTSLNCAPTIDSNGTVYLFNKQGNIYAISNTGTLKWTFEIDGGLLSSPVVTTGGNLIVGTSSGNLYNISIHGEKIWSKKIGEKILYSPCISQSTIYVCSNEILYAYSLSGKYKWEVNGEKTIAGSATVGPNGDVYFISSKLFAITVDGQIRWNVNYGNAGHLNITPTIASNEMIFVGVQESNGQCKLNVFSTEGEFLWKLENSNISNFSPIINSDGILLVNSSQRNSILGIKTSCNGLAKSNWPISGKSLNRSSSLPFKPIIIKQPEDKKIFLGEDVSFNIEVIGDPPMEFQWYKNGEIINDAINSELTIKKASKNDFSIYSVRISNSNGKTLSKIVKLSGINIGELLWEFNAEDMISKPLELNNSLYVRTNKKIINLSKDGQVINEIKTSRSIYHATYFNNTYYTGGDKLSAFNLNGTLKWEFQKDGYGSYTKPSISSDGFIYFGSTNHKIYSINPDGNKRWHFWTYGPIYAGPSVGKNGVIYVGSSDDRLYALNPDGSKKWEFLTGGNLSSPVEGEDGTVYVKSKDRNLYALTPDGKLKWSTTVGKTHWEGMSTPVIDDDGVIYYDSDYISALNPDGSVKWIFSENINTYPPYGNTITVGENGSIYVSSQGKYIYALDRYGKKQWEYKFNKIDTFRGHSSILYGKEGKLYVSYREKLLVFNTLGNLRRDNLNQNINFELFIDPNLESDDRFLIKFTSRENKIYLIETSNDLIKWELLRQATGTGNEIIIPNIFSSTDSRRFYRIKFEE